MWKVANNKTMCVGRVALQANAIPTNSVGVKLGGVVDANVDLVVDDLIKTFGLGVALVEVIDIASGRIFYGLNSELAEPVTGIIEISKGVSRMGYARQGGKSKACKAQHYDGGL